MTNCAKTPKQTQQQLKTPRGGRGASTGPSPLGLSEYAVKGLLTLRIISIAVAQVFGRQEPSSGGTMTFTSHLC